MSTRQIIKYGPLLKALNKTDAVTRKAILQSAKKDLILALVQCARAIINRSVPLTRAQSDAVKRSANDIKKLVNRKTSVEERKVVLQKGGLLSAIVGPVLRLLPAILGGVLGGGRRR